MKKLLLILLLWGVFFLPILAVPQRSASAQDYAPTGVGDTIKDFVFGAPKKIVCKILGKEDDCMNVAAWVSNAMESIVMNLVTFLGGDSILVAMGIEDSSNLTHENSGAIGVLSVGLGTVLANPPNLHTKDYIKETLANNVLNPAPAYAQTGDVFFNPIKEIWSQVRNITYVLFIVVLVMAGFMIMFGYRLDPRTRVTFISALPWFVISLILITFSFVIAGLIFDFGVLATGIINDYFVKTFQRGSLDPVQVSPLNLIWEVVIKGMWGTISIPGIFSWIVLLVFWFTGIIICFRLFFTLILRFAQLYLQVILSPIYFMWGSLPGQRDHISGWFRKITVNVLVFPVTFFLINLAYHITLLAHGGTTFGTPPGLGDPSKINIAGFVSYGILAAATKVPEALEDALAAKPSPAMGRLGADIESMARRTPLVGWLLK